MTRGSAIAGLALAGLTLLTACASAPPAAPAARYDAVAAVAAIRAIAGVQARELDVQPLRDPQVEDLRGQAQALEARGMYRAAADALDQALVILPDDPALLQERAEAALLLQQPAAAAELARRAHAGGSRVGPLCRRHWETVAQAAAIAAEDRLIRRGEDLATATARVDAARRERDTARRQRDACTVAAPARY